MMIASMVRATGVLLIVAGGLYGATAANEAQLCANAASPDATIQQCTAAIASGGLSVAEQAAAFGFRCRAYAKKHDYARALPDCERAVQLAPDSALQVYKARLGAVLFRQYRRSNARFRAGNLPRSELRPCLPRARVRLHAAGGRCLQIRRKRRAVRPGDPEPG